MSKKKYTLVKSDTVTTWDGRKPFRIKAAVAIAAIGVAKGDLGGYIESEANLSVYGDARVSGVNLTATRSDNYTFLVAPTPEGPRIIAGCRYFTFEEAEKHWSETRGGTPLGDESLSIVAHLKRMAEINGFMEPVARDPEALAAFRKEKGL